MHLIFRKSFIFRTKYFVKKRQAMVVLAFLLPILVASSKFPSQPVERKAFNPDNLPLASDSINYTIGVLPNEEYTWIITSFREKNLELLFGSTWMDVFGLSGVPQRGYKFKANVTSTQSNRTHNLLEFDAWDCLYRLTNFSVTPDRSCRYDYPIYPQNYNDTFELVSLFPLFLPTFIKCSCTDSTRFYT